MMQRHPSKIITSVSGGQTSAYVAANYPSDYLLFALVRIEDENCRFKDDKIRKLVEDRIQAPFIATSEDDTIIYTMLDLEQYLGKEITWVTGMTFEETIKYKGGFLPNKVTRYCTTLMKIEPMFQWWYKNVGEPIVMQIGYRANEHERANSMLEKCVDGFSPYKSSVEKLKDGRKKWQVFHWQKPEFPLVKDGIRKDDIRKYWENKPVRFASYNNCVGCFHRNPAFLRFMYQEHPQKMNWFENREGGKSGYWKSVNGEVIKYERIKRMMPQATLFDKDFTPCDAGYCGF